MTEKPKPEKPKRTTVNIVAQVHVDETLTTEVDVEVDDVLAAMDDDELAAAIERRHKKMYRRSSPKLTLIYEEFARRGDAPKVLKDFIYDTIGRIL